MSSEETGGQYKPGLREVGLRGKDRDGLKDWLPAGCVCSLHLSTAGVLERVQGRGGQAMAGREDVERPP